MIVPNDKKVTHADILPQDILSPSRAELSSSTFTHSPSAISKSSSNQLLLHHFITHHPKAGINPLVDNAAYLFSLIGKLKQLKFYRHLNKLHKELITEINAFQDAAKARGYNAEYIFISRYAICATLDDVIINTLWGAQGQWNNNYGLLKVFHPDISQQEQFFLILERIIKEPALYIDMMEFMYICLSLGFKGNYRAPDLDNNQLEQITHSLYKHIRAYHGDFSKSLSPFPIKPIYTPKILQQKASIPLAILVTASIIMALFIGLGYLLDSISNQAYQELTHIGKSILYDIHTA